jgi:hypothetical protein
VEEHTKKSGWIKKDGVWLKDLKFLGMRYVPEKKYVPFKEMLIIWCLLVMLDVLIGWPIFSMVMLLAVIRPQEWTDHAYFEASTRNGSTLKFTDKEAFALWLQRARDNIIENDYTERMSGDGNSLEKWLEENWLKLVEIPPARRWKLLMKSKHVGYIFSRMQSGEWNTQFEQDFRLTYNENSWMGTMWAIFARNQKIDANKISVFTSTSYASQWLLTQPNLYEREKGWKAKFLLEEGKLQRRSITTVRPVASNSVVVWNAEPLSLIPIQVVDYKFVGVVGVKGNPTLKAGTITTDTGLRIRKVHDIDLRMGKYNKDGLRPTRNLFFYTQSVKRLENQVLNLSREVTILLHEIKQAKLVNKQ